MVLKFAPLWSYELGAIVVMFYLGAARFGGLALAAASAVAVDAAVIGDYKVTRDVVCGFVGIFACVTAVPAYAIPALAVSVVEVVNDTFDGKRDCCRRCVGGGSWRGRWGIRRCCCP